jgi:hypothetical protein
MKYNLMLQAFRTSKIIISVLVTIHSRQCTCWHVASEIAIQANSVSGLSNSGGDGLLAKGGLLLTIQCLTSKSPVGLGHKIWVDTLHFFYINEHF